MPMMRTAPRIVMFGRPSAKKRIGEVTSRPITIEPITVGMMPSLRVARASCTSGRPHERAHMMPSRTVMPI